MRRHDHKTLQEEMDIEEDKENYFNFNNYNSILQQVSFPVSPQKPAKKCGTTIAPSKGINYSEVLVHNINVSLQEHQKKITVYNKKLLKKSDKKNGMDSQYSQMHLPLPDLHYMNIYTNASRLSCFKSISLNSSLDCDDDEYLQHDASTYENYLSDHCKKMS